MYDNHVCAVLPPALGLQMTPYLPPGVTITATLTTTDKVSQLQNIADTECYIQSRPPPLPRHPQCPTVTGGVKQRRQIRSSSGYCATTM